MVRSEALKALYPTEIGDLLCRCSTQISFSSRESSSPDPPQGEIRA